MNGFAKQQLEIGSKQPIHQFKQCARCEDTKAPEGGIQMSPNKWYCASCWAHRATRRPKNAKT